MAGLLQQAGAPPNRNAKFVPLFMDRAFTGLYTQRSPLRDPSDWATSKFYGGRPDALLDGSNVELTNRLTLQRRPGLTQLSTATYPSPPDRAFSFELTDGTIRLIVDTSSTGSLSVSSVDSASGTSAVYHGVFPDGAANAYVDHYFTIAGFATSVQNNGTFICTASTATTLTLTNSGAVAETISATAISTGAVYYDHQNGAKELLFGKGAGAGQTRFVAVSGVLYMGDGVEVKKYTPGNVNGVIWNWGIAAPTVQPTVSIKSAGAADTVAWQADTFFSTMGIIVDSLGGLQQLVSVNNQGDNPSSQFGTSSTGQPAWSHVIGGLTTDGSVTWRNMGTLLPWQPTTVYAEFSNLRDGVVPGPSSSLFESNIVYIVNGFPALETSEATKPPFNGTPGQLVNVSGSNHITYHGLNVMSTMQWVPGRLISDIFTFAVEQPSSPAPGQTTYLHEVISTGGTSAASFPPNWGTRADLTSAGEFTPDGQLIWVCLASAANASWQANLSYHQWTNSNDTLFNTIVDSNGNLQICVVSGTSGSAPPVWGVTYGDVTGEADHGGTAKWANAGIARGWNSGKTYNLPAPGFSPATSHSQFGGSATHDDAGNVQFCIQSGMSQNPGPPAWDHTVGDLTADNEIYWYNNGVFDSNSFSWSKGLQYVYAFKARESTDIYNTTAPPMWQSATNPQALGAYKGSGTGAISSASPKVVITGGHSTSVVNISGVGSTDPQVDTIEIYRTTDGGSTFLFLTDIPNPSPVSGNPGTWSISDYMADTPTETLPGLNPLIQAPVDNVNNPPNAAFLPMAYNYQRIWGAVGSSVFFSGGPDTLVGNPNEAFDVADTFPYLANVVRLVKTTRGLVVFLPNSIELIAGGPSTASFFSVTLAPGVGLKSYNALDVYAGEIFFFSADSQFKVISPELQLADFGFPIGDQLHNWDSSAVYVAVLQAGLDSCIFLADGSTGWYRLNPRQVPGGFSGPEPIWSPFADITNGCKMVQAVETQPGVIELLVGSDDPSRKILVRDLSTFTDDGTTYDAWFTMGSIMLSNPGQIAVLKFIEADFSGVQYQPTVSFLLNEIAGTFTSFTLPPVFAPPQIYGKRFKPTSYSPNRYYFTATKSIARCRHLQIKVDLGSTSNGDEMFNLTIFGRLVVEP